MELQLAGRRALITGGSRGIGLACAHALAAEGVDLAIAARTVEPLKEATRALRDGYDVTVTSHSCDLTRPDHQRALAEVVGSVDILVTAAGRIPAGDLLSTDDAAWRRAWELSVFGVMNLNRLMLAGMTMQRSGVIVNVVAGVTGDEPGDDLAAAAGGSALETLTAGLGPVAATDGVRAVAVRVGAGVESSEAAAVADVVVFLASARASMVSGTVLAVDGGASRSGTSARSLRARRDG
ncbi:MAG: SDR family NAD(P)-dependent oxidoreductase [Actinomycetota bacterium]